MPLSAWTSIGAVSIAWLAAAPSAQAQQYNLTGLWQDNTGTGGAYLVRQIGSKVYWASPERYAQRNVFVGNIVGNTLDGEWADLPGSPAQGGGRMTLRIESNNRFVKLSNDPCCYRAEVWTRQGTSSAAPCAYSLPGTWNWRWGSGSIPGQQQQGQTTVTVSTNGAMTSIAGNNGTWTCTGQQASFQWSASTDNLTVTPGRLEGRSKEGSWVLADKR